MLKIHIIFNFKQDPWGGGNQFLKALREEFRRQGVYADSLKEADIVLFNSHHFLYEALLAKIRYPQKVFIHRLDGIMELTRNNPSLDKRIFIFNHRLADGTIFQSQWAKRKIKEIGYFSEGEDTVIMNAPDPLIFNKIDKSDIHQPIRLIASSWSTNMNKGFEYLEWLDRNLNFEQFQLTFIGNSPVSFKKIHCIPPKLSSELASTLKQHDIYIFPGKDDACSNSLIEAMHCGLPVVFLNSGGNPEIVGKAGEPFNNTEELLRAINNVANSYSESQQAISLPDIKGISYRYLEFFKKIQYSKLTVSNKKIELSTSSRVLFLLSELRDSFPAYRFFHEKINAQKYSFYTHKAKSSSLARSGKREKIAINMKPRTSPWGGGNQFVEQFSSYLRSRGHIVTYQLERDVSCILIVKSWSSETTQFDIGEIRRFKKHFPDVPCIHRINECDQRKGTDYVDELLRQANGVADFTIFISYWLENYFLNRWFNINWPHQVIQNGADENIFYPKNDIEFSEEDKFRIVTHHWSDNWMKGFKVYQEFDRMIADGELNEFSFMIIGSWPREVRWRSAITHPPIRGKKLGNLLRKNHAYLTASLWEPCGMHHIEGAQCGLPLIYHEDGGGVVEFGRQYGIGFKDNLKEALINARQSYPLLRKKVFDFMPSGLKMCSLYEKLFVSLVNKNKSK